MPLCISLRSARSKIISNNTLTIRKFLFSTPLSGLPPAIVSTSTRIHGEFVHLLFLQAHRETEVHLTATGMPSQQNISDSFRLCRAAFYQSLKNKSRRR